MLFENTRVSNAKKQRRACPLQEIESFKQVLGVKKNQLQQKYSFIYILVNYAIKLESLWNRQNFNTF
jgi:hypothetical protein